MKTRPILFSTPMVQAILTGNKTQTRRIVKPPYSTYPAVTKHITSCEFDFHYPDRIGQYTKSPYGKPGDQLWVRETWVWEGDTSWKDLMPLGSFFYKADFEEYEGPTKWKPSIFMPREASRITLEITNIRVERLQDISYKDAKAEGVEYPHDFCKLWEAINGIESWIENPWVWIIEFKKLDES